MGQKFLEPASSVPLIGRESKGEIKWIKNERSRESIYSHPRSVSLVFLPEICDKRCFFLARKQKKGLGVGGGVFLAHAHFPLYFYRSNFPRALFWLVLVREVEVGEALPRF